LPHELIQILSHGWPGDGVQITLPPAWNSGRTLHSYHFAWAERAKVVGMPERFAQEALGHNSKAVHRAYAKGALMKIPSLEEYEERVTEKLNSELEKHAAA
jgi:integrase